MPKELVVPVCQRLSFVGVVMCSTALAIRLHALYKMGKLGRWSHDKSKMPDVLVNGTHYFMDIGLGNNGDDGRSHTKVLEGRGWRGACVDPFPDTSRKCTVIDMPVAPRSGQQVELTDCTAKNTLQVLMSATARALGRHADDCPIVQRTALSITDLLQLAKAPRVIDYLSLDTGGSELDVLEAFPFGDFCVRAWTVRHGDAQVSASIRKLLASHNSCKVKEAGPSYWARCSCSGFSESLLAHRAIANTEEASKARGDSRVLNRKHKRHWKGSAMVSSALLEDSPDPSSSPDASGSLLRRPDA